MDFRMLGPLEVVEAGRRLELGGQKQRAVLAVLLLESNCVVSTERLIDALWEDEPPETASKALQVYVSQLRKLLGKDRLRTQAPGYVLRVDAAELDLSRFHELREDGRLEDALALWRGPPLAEFGSQRFASVEIARLEELRLACLEERLERDLAGGPAARLVGELERLVAAHPLRERLRAQLMLALYRSGRQAEALEAYQDGRRALVDELGIEPGRALRELHQAILNQDPALEPETDQALSSRPEPIASPKPDDRGGAREVRKTVTVVSVALAIASVRDDALDPEALRHIAGDVFGQLERAIERHGGVVDSAGDEGLTAIFGLPVVHEDDAIRGLRAAAEARTALHDAAAALRAEREVELQFRVGVSTGEVVTGADAGREQRTTGEPLPRSARLARSAGDGEVLFDAGAWRLVRELVGAEAVDGAWRLLDVADAVTAPRRRLDSPMVGRERERRRLHDAFQQAVGDRSCQLFTVLGPAGVGKSRLVAEFVGDVEGQARIARGRCLPYGEGITYWPLLEVVKELVGLDDADSADDARTKLAAALGAEHEADLLAGRVADLIGIAEVEAGAEEGFVAAQTLFESVARVQPVVLLFDDIHWGEPRFLDLVEHLADWSRDASILLVCLARPELLEVRPGWGGGKLNATAALLEPLSDEECSQLIENLVGQTELAREVGVMIATAAEGNPLFVEEMLSMLIDDGLLVREGARWSAAGDVSAIRVPPTIQALLAARLDRLDGPERAAIERAAVAGKVFQEGAVVDLSSGATRSDVHACLGALVRKELIRPEAASLGEPSYRFRHLLIRDAAYESIAKEERAGLHERFGRWLQAVAGERTIEYEEVLGYHFEQSYRYRAELGSVDGAARAIGREAAERLGSAGRRAFARSDAPAGLNLIFRAMTLLSPDDPLRVELVPNVRVVQGLALDLSWADRVLTDAVEAAATTGDRRLAARALVQRGLLRLFTESDVTPEELIEGADRSIAVFEELGDELGQARAWRLKAQAHYLARRAGASAVASERALAHSRRADDRFEEQEIVEWLAIALFLGPAPVDEAARRCARLRLETEGHAVQALVFVCEGTLLAMREESAKARELRDLGRTIMVERGVWIWIASFWWAFISLWEGEPAAAEDELRPGYEALKKLGSKSHFTSFAHLLANAVYAQGRYEEAELLTRECEEAVRPNDVHSHIGWRATRAKVLARRGAAEEAEALAREALAIASTSDFLPAHADALMDLAEVLGLGGDEQGAAVALEEAIRIYELKGNALAVRRARGQLAAGPSRRSV